MGVVPVTDTVWSPEMGHECVLPSAVRAITDSSVRAAIAGVSPMRNSAVYFTGDSSGAVVRVSPVAGWARVRSPDCLSIEATPAPNQDRAAAFDESIDHSSVS